MCASEQLSAHMLRALSSSMYPSMVSQLLLCSFLRGSSCCHAPLICMGKTKVCHIRNSWGCCCACASRVRWCSMCDEVRLVCRAW